MTTIAGHTLTAAEIDTLNYLRQFLRDWSGDTGMQPGHSPMGDGRWVPLTEIFSERTNAGSAKRVVARRLADLGVLRACEIAYHRGCVKAAPLEKMDATVATAEASSPGDQKKGE